MKTSKLIIFSSFIVGVLLLNVGVLTSNGSMKRLLMLKNVESLANDENDKEEGPSWGGWEKEGYELRTKACDSGNGYEKVCEVYMGFGGTCDLNDEVPCKPDGSDENTVKSGSSNKLCDKYGHNFINLSIQYNQCARCGMIVFSEN